MKDPTWDIPEEKPEEIYPPCLDCDGLGWKHSDDYDCLDWLGCSICQTCDGKGYIVEDDEEIPY